MAQPQRPPDVLAVDDDLDQPGRGRRRSARGAAADRPEAAQRVGRRRALLAPDAVAAPDLVRTLQDFVKAEIAPYKYPRAIAFVDALPKTASGKIQRFELRKRAEREAAATTL